MTEYTLVSKKVSEDRRSSIEIPDNAENVSVEFDWQKNGWGRRTRIAQVDYLLPVDDV